MCPDPQLISVYLDKELSSPWKEKLEKHLEECPECKKRLLSYKGLFADQGDNKMSGEHQQAVIEAAKNRVWQRHIQHARYRSRTVNIWSRKISVPLPAAAAAVLIFVLAVFLIARPGDASVNPGIIIASEEALIEMAPVSDMDDVLQYLGGFDSADTLVIRLPENSNFTSSGNPVVVKTASFSRRAP